MSKLTPVYETIGSEKWLESLTDDEFRNIVKSVMPVWRKEMNRRVEGGISPFDDDNYSPFFKGPRDRT